jgi:hypothetical protein
MQRHNCSLAAQVSLDSECYADKAHRDDPRTEKELGGWGEGG